MSRYSTWRGIRSLICAIVTSPIIVFVYGSLSSSELSLLDFFELYDDEDKLLAIGSKSSSRLKTPFTIIFFTSSSVSLSPFCLSFSLKINCNTSKQSISWGSDIHYLSVGRRNACRISETSRLTQLSFSRLNNNGFYFLYIFSLSFFSYD